VGRVGEFPERSLPKDAFLRAPSGGRVDVGTSFEDFFELENAGLFGAIYLLTGNRSDAEDLMQLAFLKVWERWSVVRDMDNPAGYLYRTALNAFHSQRRRALVAARRAIKQLAVREGEQVEQRDEVDRALASLTPRQRQAVVLVDVLQFPADEAARLLGMAPSTLRVQLARGRDRARTELGVGDG
jgi:RNA polymerase sigma factor (sigma-70 family)